MSTPSNFEFLGNSQPHELLETVRGQLGPHLCHSDVPAFDQLRDLLAETTELATSDELIVGATNALSRVAQHLEQLQKEPVIGEIVDSFPDPITMDQLPTPRQYLRKQKIDSGYRSRLDEARQKLLSDTRENLRQGLLHLEEPAQVEHGIHEETVSQAVEDVRLQSYQNIDVSVTYILQALPRKPARIAASRILRHVGFTVDPLPMEQLSGGVYPNVQRAIDRVVKGIEGLKPDASKVPDEVAERLMPEVVANVRRQLLARYGSIVALETTNELPYLLESAYEEIIKNGLPQQTAPTAPKAAPLTGRETVTHEPAADTKHELKRDTSMAITELGMIHVECPWLPPGAQATVSRAESQAGSLLLVEALSEGHQKISRKVRSNPPTAAKLDEIWRQSLVTELEDPTGSVLPRRRISGDLNDDYADYPILYLSKKGPNVGRVYYIRTAASNILPTDEQETCIVKVAETDKAHQLDTFGVFGIKRSVARRGGAGSI